MGRMGYAHPLCGPLSASLPQAAQPEALLPAAAELGLSEGLNGQRLRPRVLPEMLQSIGRRTHAGSGPDAGSICRFGKLC